MRGVVVVEGVVGGGPIEEGGVKRGVEGVVVVQVRVHLVMEMVEVVVDGRAAAPVLKSYPAPIRLLS